MSGPAPQRLLERLEEDPEIAVAEAEYHRLLGYPRGHVPSDRACELAAWARAWYAAHGRPWIYWREVSLELTPDTLRLDGSEIHSPHLRSHLVEARAERAVVMAVSAGSACEEQANILWQQGRPDEYFFLEILGSAVVEQLVASLSGRLCDVAESEGFMATPHYSPGYPGWDVADQHRLFALISAPQQTRRPGPLEVLPSGMLRPKKSLLGVIPLAARVADAVRPAALVPCEHCSYSPCRYRRVPYRHAATATAAGSGAAPADLAVSHPRGAALAQNAKYSVNPRALEKWKQERVHLDPRPDGTTAARFRFDGTTCANMGRPLAFDYCLVLGPAEQGYPILEALCQPAPDDTGHQHMCAYLNDGPGLMKAIAAEHPLLGQPLNDVLAWKRRSRPSGCYCETESRLHKWGLALEAIHFALVRADRATHPSRFPAAPASLMSATISP